MTTIERAFDALCMAALLGGIGVLCNGCTGSSQNTGATVRRVGCAVAVPACAIVERVCAATGGGDSGGAD